MFIIYRIFSILLNAVAMLLAFSMIMSLPVIFSSPLNMLSGFLVICIILYAWFSSRFSRMVLQQKQPVKRKLRDWIKVNAIASLLYSLLIISAATYLLFDTTYVAEFVKNLPEGIAVQEADMKKLFIFMLIYAIVLLLHILLTFYYMRKNKAFFTVE